MSAAHAEGDDGPTPGPRPIRFRVGDTVELCDAVFDTVGTVVAIVSIDEVQVEWNTGHGLLGKTLLTSAGALRRRRDRVEP